MTTTTLDEPVTVADLVAALRVQQSNTAAGNVSAVALRSQGWIPQPHTLVVLGAHPGAGATTVSVALTDAIVDLGSGRRSGGVRLIDAAPREESGMGPAVECAVGGADEGWRAGRRGESTILRPAISPGGPGALPTISGAGNATAPAAGLATGSGSRAGSLAGPGWLVIDAGWSWREVMASRGQLRTLLERAQVLVVCRASVPGVRSVELVLEALPGRPVVAAVGARRWPVPVEASFGPRLGGVVEDGRSVLIPADRRVEVNGINTEALPGAISDAASRLARLLWPGLGTASSLGSRRASRKRGGRR